MKAYWNIYLTKICDIQGSYNSNLWYYGPSYLNLWYNGPSNSNLRYNGPSSSNLRYNGPSNTIFERITNIIKNHASYWRSNEKDKYCLCRSCRTKLKLIYY